MAEVAGGGADDWGRGMPYGNANCGDAADAGTRCSTSVKRVEMLDTCRATTLSCLLMSARDLVTASSGVEVASAADEESSGGAMVSDTRLVGARDRRR